MAYFPFMIDIENQNCLVVGGGKIAYHKVKLLLPFGVRIRLVAEEICEELWSLQQEEKGLTMTERVFRAEDIQNADMVVAATDDDGLNRHISALCKQEKIPVNVVDVKEACSFIVPAIIRDKELLVAVSTGGRSPAAAAFVKQRIREQIPDYYGDLIDALGAYRERVLQLVDTGAKRKAVFTALLEYGAEHEGRIPEAVAEQVIQQVNAGENENSMESMK